MNYQEIERFCMDNQILLLVVLAVAAYFCYQNLEVRMFVERNQTVILIGLAVVVLYIVMGRENIEQTAPAICPKKCNEDGTCSQAYADVRDRDVCNILGGAECCNNKDCMNCTVAPAS